MPPLRVAWGHKCCKSTWLYLVGVPLDVQAEALAGGTPTHVITSSKRFPRVAPVLASSQAHITPPAFAEWLVSLARRSILP